MKKEEELMTREEAEAKMTKLFTELNSLIYRDKGDGIEVSGTNSLKDSAGCNKMVLEMNIAIRFCYKN